jgi:hypothetical protein
VKTPKPRSTTGGSITLAATTAGVSRRVAFDWMARHPALRERFDHARAEHESRLAATLAAAATSDWRASAQMLVLAYPGGAQIVRPGYPNHATSSRICFRALQSRFRE